jgi:hypothetical protein
LEREPLVDDEIDMSRERVNTTTSDNTTPKSNNENDEDKTLVSSISGDVSALYSLQEFYDTYK